MPAANYLPDVLETTEAERLATGFIFTEGPLWHPDDYWYFVDLRRNHLHRLTPGKEPELVRTTIGGNGTTFDLQGRLIVCEGDDRRLTRMGPDGTAQTLVDNYKGGRFNRPNDVICHSNGCLYFTDPEKRRPYHEREIPGPAGENNLWDGACVYRLAPDGGLSVLAHCEYPNGLALSPDERTMYVANTRSSQYIHAIRLDAAGNMVDRNIFADLNGSEPGIPDGLKVDSIGRVYCTGPGGIWVMAPDGKRVGVIRWPEQAVNFAFGGPDLRTLFCCAHTSVYTLRSRCRGTRIPGTSCAGRTRSLRNAGKCRPSAEGKAMPEKSMKEKLAAGELVLCMNLRLARSVDIAMVAKAGGYDALYVDMQHAPYSIETTSTICAASIGIGITPLVRVPSHDPQWMSRVLDGGALGVILPDVNTRAQAEAIVRACRFPPLGKRSVMGLGPALGYRAVPLSELNPKLNAETAVIVMLETAEGIENCEAIAAVEAVDVLLIGSGDLTTDLGIPGQVDHPRLRAAYERVAAACRTHNKVLGVGGIRHNTGLQGELIGLGARFVIAGTDTNYVLAGARQDTAALRAIKIG